jgi:hypothetical protein
MLARVAKHVAQSVPHLSRRSQDAVVVAVCKHVPGASPESIQRASHADRQTLQSARKGKSRVALHDQVHVIRLHAEMDEPKPIALATRGNRAAHSRELTQSPQRRQSWLHAQRHFHRKAIRERDASPVRDVRALAAPLGSRSLATSAPAVGKHELFLCRSRANTSPTNRSRLLRHLNLHHYNARALRELLLNGQISRGIDSFPPRGIRAEKESAMHTSLCTHAEVQTRNVNQSNAALSQFEAGHTPPARIADTIHVNRVDHFHHRTPRPAPPLPSPPAPPHPAGAAPAAAEGEERLPGPSPRLLFASLFRSDPRAATSHRRILQPHHASASVPSLSTVFQLRPVVAVPRCFSITALVSFERPTPSG